MDEELEQSEESQLITELEQSEENQNQLIEIYKLQSQLANSISNKRITINRFYILVMSGLVLIFPTFTKLPTEIQNLFPFEYIVVGLAFLGINLSLAWFILINSNLRLCMIKYEALKRLEEKLEYQFLKDEWEFLEKYGKGRTYWEISYVEIFIPILFFLIFSFMLNLVFVSSSGIFYILFKAYPSFIIGFICGRGFQSWQIDREIRGAERWTNRKINWVSYTIMFVYLSLIVILPTLIDRSNVNNKEAESVNGNSTETSPDKTAIEQIVLPEGKQAESVNEKSKEVDSEENTKK